MAEHLVVRSHLCGSAIVAGLVKRFQIDVHPIGQLFHRAVLGDREQAVTMLAGISETLRVVGAREPQRRMRLLLRPRPDPELLEVEMLAVVTERLSRPRFAKDLQPLERAGLAL